jgi:hypothetical protein
MLRCILAPEEYNFLATINDRGPNDFFIDL